MEVPETFREEIRTTRKAVDKKTNGCLLHRDTNSNAVSIVDEVIVLYHNLKMIKRLKLLPVVSF